MANANDTTIQLQRGLVLHSFAFSFDCQAHTWTAWGCCVSPKSRPCKTLAANSSSFWVSRSASKAQSKVKEQAFGEADTAPHVTTPWKNQLCRGSQPDHEHNRLRKQRIRLSCPRTCLRFLSIISKLGCRHQPTACTSTKAMSRVLQLD
jgi:hypothetical protein